MAAVAKPCTTQLWRCARHGGPVLRIQKRKRRSICPARNHGGRKGLGVRAPVTNRRRSGVEAASCSDPSRAIIPRKFQKPRGVLPFKKHSANGSKRATFW